jgi:protoporphyrinogen oxidase
MSPAKISPIFAASKIHKLDLKDIINKLLGGKGEEQETYWKDLLYPKKGSGQLFEKLKDEILKKGGVIHTGVPSFNITIIDDKAARVTYKQNGNQKNIQCEAVFSSIPLPELITALQPKPNEYVWYKNKLLKFKSLILVNLLLDTPRVTRAHWVYLVDKRFTFNRLTEQKNMSSDLGPPDKTILTFEKSCNYCDDIWNKSDEELYRDTLEEITHIKLIDRSRIIKYKVERIQYAYPVYDLEFDKNIRIIFDYLSNVRNLYSIGRQGLFLQNDMHDSMEIGRLAVECLAHKKMLGRDWYEYMLRYWNI